MADDMSTSPRRAAATSAVVDAPPPPAAEAPVRPTPEAPPAAAPEPAPAAAAPAAAAAAKTGNPRRARLFGALAAVVVLGLLTYGVYWLLVGSHYVSTDNAYVGADAAQVTPQVAGQVAEVRVADTQTVKAGDVLVVIDPADARLAEAQAEADYGRAVRRVRQDLATNSQLNAQIAARDADLARAKAQLAAAQADVDRTRIDLQRRQALAASGAVSGEELTTAKNAAATAEANLEATRAAGVQAQANKAAAVAQAQAQAALTDGASIDSNPEVAAAKAALDTARLNLSRTVIRAPVDGVVSKRNVQVGQRVAVGASLMTIAPLRQAYVDANFKEVQLRKVKVGQPVELKSDLYGSKVKFHGRVVGFAGGTGSAFAVIPAQNATGNWIKVVQRLPIRVQLDEKELAQHPLRIGSSMEATVNVSAKGDSRADTAPGA
jgi:membrane fusion protein (multidrug efflux system)